MGTESCRRRVLVEKYGSFKAATVVEPVWCAASSDLVLEQLSGNERTRQVMNEIPQPSYGLTRSSEHRRGQSGHPVTFCHLYANSRFAARKTDRPLSLCCRHCAAVDNDKAVVCRKVSACVTNELEVVLCIVIKYRVF